MYEILSDSKKKLLEVQNSFPNSRVNITAKKKTHWCSYRAYIISWRISERFSKRSGQSIFHFVNNGKQFIQHMSVGFKSKLNYLLRTIPNIYHSLLLLERTTRNKLVLAVRGGHICNDKERVLISLPTRYGGLDIPIFHETTEIEFMNSSKVTS